MKRISLIVFIVLPVLAFSVDFSYLDPDLPIETRVDRLLNQMSLQEKAAQLNRESFCLWSGRIQPVQIPCP